MSAVSENTRRTLARSSALLSGAGLASRISGMAREALKSHLFGASAAVSAFDAIFDLHILLYDWLAGSIQSAVLLPAFTAHADPDHVQDFRRLLTLLSVVYTLVLGPCALAFALAPRFFFGLVGAGLGADVIPLSVSLMRLMAPLVWALGLQGLWSAALYARQRFLAPALAPGILNLVMMGVVLWGARAGWDARILGLGVVTGSLAVLGWLGWALRDTPPLWRAWREMAPVLQRMALLSLPLLAGMALDQFTVGLRLNLISRTGTAGIAWSKYATFVMQVPFSVAVLAVGIAVLPLLTQAALARREADVRALTAQAMRLTLLLVLPCFTLGMVLAEPLIGVLYQHGAFTAADTLHTAQVLRLLLFWLLLAALDQPLNMAFYAHRDTLSPVLANTAGVVAYIALALVSVALWGPQLLLLTAVQVVQLGTRVTLMLWGFRRRYGSLRGAGWSSAVLVLGASLGAALLAALVRWALEGHAALTWRGWLVQLLAAGGGGAGLYVGLLVAWRHPDIMGLVQAVRHRGRGCA